MRKGFTLMELMIVIIIVGVLATLGFVQYTRAIEKGRGAEARQMLGAIKDYCAAQYLEDNALTDCTNANIATALGVANSNACNAQSWFWYSVANVGTTSTITATRCQAGEGGKNPAGTIAGTVVLTVVHDTGAVSLTTTGAYQ